MTLLNILLILTSHSTLSADPAAMDADKTGVWFEELSTPYYALADAGAEVTLVSIDGGEVPIDPRSLKPVGENEASVERFLEDPAAMEAMETTQSLVDIDMTEYDAVFLAGGHGTMWDFPASEALASGISGMLENGKPVAAVCHGPAGLVSALNENGEPVVAGRRVTTFTNAEEDAVGLTDAVPFLLETRLRELGATVVVGPNFEPNVVVDGLLITGQNPASAAPTAAALIELLKQTADVSPMSGSAHQ
nr:type 1 glutamine amidotransferase domain-containing protein [uncultured Halomonas sp.]